jgi:hypothetical protein
MKRIEVSCITKTDKNNPHEKISHVGGIHKDTFWKVPIDEAIHNIEMGFFIYYVGKNGIEVDLEIATRDGNKYLKTKNDDTEINNLLELKQCFVR